MLRIHCCHGTWFGPVGTHECKQSFMSWSLSAGPETRFWKHRGFSLLSVMSQSIWAIYSFSCRLRSPFCPAVPCAERSDGKSQHGWTMPTLLSGQYLCHRSWALGSPCTALPLSQALRSCCEFTHTNPNSSSVDILLVHTQHCFSNSVILPYSCNCRMKWKVIKGSFLLMVNRTVGISIERKISQQEYYYGGLWFRW